MSDFAHDFKMDYNLASEKFAPVIYTFMSERKGQEFTKKDLLNYLSENKISYENQEAEIFRHLQFLVDLGFLSHTLMGFRISYERW